MSKFTIKEGKHYNTKAALDFPWVHVNQREFKKTVRFSENCEYKLADYNSGDVNKLFGASFGLNGPHVDSARFGWRYSNSAQKIELLAYCYEDGKRNWDTQLRFPVIAQINVEEEVDCLLVVTETEYIFTVKKNNILLGEEVRVKHGKLSYFGMLLSLFFGGAIPTPHLMNVWMK